MTAQRQVVSIFLVCLVVAILAFPTTKAEAPNVAQTRMVGGEIITIDKAPYAVQIRTIYGDFGCGGTLVTPQHVVTAAHCLERCIPTRHLVIFGGVSTSNGPGFQRSVIDFFVPSDYLRATFNSDVAILKLNSPMPLGTHIQTIPLCTKALLPGDLAQVVGWGKMTANGTVSQDLRSMRFPIITNEKCSKKFNLTSTMVCGLAPNEGPCKGDSGGPVVHGGELCAVVSWGRKNCLYDDTPAVYTSIDAMRSFIESSLKK